MDSTTRTLIRVLQKGLGDPGSTQENGEGGRFTPSTASGDEKSSGSATPAKSKDLSPERISAWTSESIDRTTPGLQDRLVEIDRSMPPTYAEATATAEANKIVASPEALALVAPLAEEIVAHSEESEKVLTPLVASIAEATNGTQEGLQNALKTEASMERKLAMDVEFGGRTPEDAAGRISDGVRYTIVYDAEDYAASVTAAMDALEASGLQPLKSAPEFAPTVERPSVQMLTTWHDPVTQANVEVQFHTPDMLMVKESANHSYYEAERTLPKGDPMKAELGAKMEEFSSQVPIPPGVESWKDDPRFDYDNREQ